MLDFRCSMQLINGRATQRARNPVRFEKPNMPRKLIFNALVLAALVLAPARAGAIELGLTPDHVYSLWININNSLLVIGRSISEDASWNDRLKALAPRQFSGKQPPDTLASVNAYRLKLDRLRELAALGPTKRFNHGDFSVTPRIVYVNSGHVLNGQIELLVNRTPPDLLVSPFYVQHDFNSMSVSDNFALIDLADRRLDLILQFTGL